MSCLIRSPVHSVTVTVLGTLPSESVNWTAPTEKLGNSKTTNVWSAMNLETSARPVKKGR